MKAKNQFLLLQVIFVALFFLMNQGLSEQAPDPNRLAAEDYLKKGNLPKAIEALEVAISLDPKADPEVYLMLAAAHFNLDQKEKSLQAIETGLQHFPASSRLQKYYVSLLHGAGFSLQDARQRLEVQAQQDPKSLIYQKALGELLMKENPLSRRAEQLLATVVAKSPQDAEAHYLYGQWLSRNNQWVSCLGEMQKALALTPAKNESARMQIYLTIAGAENQLNHAQKAEVAYKKALEINRGLSSHNPAAAYLYVKFLLDHGRTGEAQPLLEEILKWAPNFGPARLKRAQALSHEGKLPEALSDALVALEDPGNDPEDLRSIHAFLARTYFALGKTEEARVHQNWLKANLK